MLTWNETYNIRYFLWILIWLNITTDGVSVYDWIMNWHLLPPIPYNHIKNKTIDFKE